uniref:Dehydrogenase/reductase 2 n=1 Tax=Ursus americanus TaxID=9643 RepID=A0A452QM32_URSAM
MFRAASWAFRGLRRSSVPLSARMSSNRADRSCALAEKVAVITGSTKGIGFAIARRLAEDGAHVVISSRKQQNVDRAVAELQGEGLSVTGTVCHVGKAEDRERLVATVSVYNTSKTALLGLCKSLAVELAPKGIRVNCLVDWIFQSAGCSPLLKSENGTAWG